MRRLLYLGTEEKFDGQELSRNEMMEMENIKISVCIPFYNIAQYVNRCLDSILNNTYKNLEVICVNDGSTDETLEILKEYKKRDPRIIVIDKENGGLPSARNAALDCCSGDFIAVVDGDDWVHNQYFEILLNVQRKTEADVVICDNMVCSEDNGEDKEYHDEDYTIKCFGLNQLIKDSNGKNRIWGRIYSKNIIEKNRLPQDINIGEDILFNMYVLCQQDSIKIASVDLKLYYYFNRADSIVHTVKHSDIVYLSFYFLSKMDEFSEDGKIVILEQIFNSMFAYRYLEMFSSDKKKVNDTCRQLYEKCKLLEKENPERKTKLKLKYIIIYHCPMIYRLMRIIKDPTLLAWEKNQRKWN